MYGILKKSHLNLTCTLTWSKAKIHENKLLYFQNNALNFKRWGNVFYIESFFGMIIWFKWFYHSKNVLAEKNPLCFVNFSLYHPFPSKCSVFLKFSFCCCLSHSEIYKQLLWFLSMRHNAYSADILAQSQQWELQNNVINLFNVRNQDIKTMPVSLILSRVHILLWRFLSLH